MLISTKRCRSPQGSLMCLAASQQAGWQRWHLGTVKVVWHCCPPSSLSQLPEQDETEKRENNRKRKHTLQNKTSRICQHSKKALGGSPSVVALFLQQITDTAASTSIAQGKRIMHGTLHSSVFLFCCKRELVRNDKQRSSN